MPRPSAPWYRAATGWWMVTLGGEKIKLLKGDDTKEHRDLAQEKWVELRKARRDNPESPTATVQDIVEAFLLWSAQHLGTETHRVLRGYCGAFAEYCGTVRVSTLKPFHVTRWVSYMMSKERVQEENQERERAVAAGEIVKRFKGGKLKPWGLATAHNAKAAAFRVFSWATEEGLLPSNPLKGLKRPKAPPRQRAMSDDEFRKLHKTAKPAFADLLFALRETGARPKELRTLQWDQVQDDRLVLLQHKTVKATGQARVILIMDAMKALLKKLKRRSKGEFVFVNVRGEPWTANAISQQIGRLRKKLGLRSDLCAYLARHGFGTRAILSGVDALTVAKLMGHTSMDMVSKVYVHLADEHQHLKDAMDKINPPKKKK